MKHSDEPRPRIIRWASYGFLFALAIILMLFLLNAQDNSPSQRTAITRPPASAGPDWTEKQEAEWQAASTAMSRISNSNISADQKCQSNWDIVWPLAKKDNLAARFSLYEAFSNWLTLSYKEGSTHQISRSDMLSNLFFYSLGAPEMNAEMELMRDHYKKYPAVINDYSPVLSHDQAVLQCVLEKATQECTQMLVARASIPSFDRFAEEIDLLISSGAQIKCLSNAVQPAMQ